MAWSVPGAADPAVMQPAPCRALLRILAASGDPGTAVARAGPIGRVDGADGWVKAKGQNLIQDIIYCNNVFSALIHIFFLFYFLILSSLN